MAEQKATYNTSFENSLRKTTEIIDQLEKVYLLEGGDASEAV